MTLFFVLLTLAVVGVVAAVALGRISGGLDEPTSTVPVHPLPEGELAPSDLDEVRFAPALRGYRMDQVDAALDRLRGELARRDEELAGLRGGRNEVLVGAVAGATAGSAGGAKERTGPAPAPVAGAEPAPAEPVVPVAPAEPEGEPVRSEPTVPVATDDLPTAAQPVVVDEPAGSTAEPAAVAGTEAGTGVDTGTPGTATAAEGEAEVEAGPEATTADRPADPKAPADQA